jgi:hypothetical protein
MEECRERLRVLSAAVFFDSLEKTTAYTMRK